MPAAHPRVLVAHPSGELYGSDRMLYESVAALAAAGWDVLVALATDGPLRALLEGTGARVVVAPAPVVRKNLLSPAGVVRFAAANLRAAPRLWRLLRGFGPDVVYVSTVTVPLWLLVGRLATRRTVCHVHEAEEGVPRPVRLALALPLLLARVVLANSRLSRDVVVRDLAALGRRTRVLYNGVPGPERWTPPRPALIGPVRLVLVGRVSPRKGTDVAVAALGHLRERGVEAELTLVGAVFEGYEWFEREVRDEAARRGLEAHVHWRGVLPVIWEELAAADVALVPSRVEPFGNAAVEALLACRPVVVGDTQGLREIVEPGVDGERAAAGDAVALADAVERVLTDWDGAVRRALTARERAAGRFGTQRYRDELVEVLAALPRR
ncbi:MAG TPA: glycosyltransferase family 4 protein [Kineosporiaceae bacterium]|nr:glycosyltransferase family 4 protein [Kineosporiaceae bacterium]